MLVVVVVQGKKIDEISQKIDSKVAGLHYELQGEISNISNIIRSELEESDRVVVKSEFEPVGINKDTKQLLESVRNDTEDKGDLRYGF